ncbi:MAG: Holliday junction branch migration protein RuvA [Cyanobacteria bacterium J083]|nr:MAG: Holliday junction branch migration protein RuvA [Cyanobacteria bacterium J083]
MDIYKNTSNRVILALDVQGVGYEIQIPSPFSRKLSTEAAENTKIFTHLQSKDDRQVLYGFATSAERDLFRQLISVSGIGAQLAIALIETLGLSDLVQAIVTTNVRMLSKTPGVGAKTAERIALELRTKLAKWREIQGITISTTSAMPAIAVLEDLEMTLLALGYTKEEIEKAVAVLSKDNLLLKNPNPEEWIRSAISWLSNQ